MRVVNVLLVAAALFLSPVIASAQTGEIIGQVRDASGAVLTGVTVTVSGAALIEGTRETATDESGRFVNGILDKVKGDLMRPARIVKN